MMKRTNTFEAVPQTKSDRELLLRFLDASAACWNAVNYAWRQQYFDGDGLWDSNWISYDYVRVLGGTCLQSGISPEATLEAAGRGMTNPMVKLRQNRSISLLMNLDYKTQI